MIVYTHCKTILNLCMIFIWIAHNLTIYLFIPLDYFQAFINTFAMSNGTCKSLCASLTDNYL